MNRHTDNEPGGTLSGIVERETPHKWFVWVLVAAAAAVLFCVAMSASYVLLLDFFTPGERVRLGLYLGLVGVFWLCAVVAPIWRLRRSVRGVAPVYLMCLPVAVSLVVFRVIPNQLSYLVYVLLGVSVPVFCVGCFWWLRSLRRQEKPKERPRRSRVHRAIIVSVLVLIMLAGISLPIYKNQKTVGENRNLLNSAVMHFQVTAPGVTQKSINATLVDLERAYEELDDHLSAAERTVIMKVRLFPSLDAFQQYTNGQYLGITSCSDGAPAITLPARQPGDALPGQPGALTPRHEMVHAMICMTAGPISIPRWFHEGLAEYETLKGVDWLVSRTGLRLFLWGERDRIPSQNALASYSPDSSTKELEGLHYATSFELMRYIVRSLKGRSPWMIVREVSEGRSFDSCLEDATGHGFGELYGEWLVSFRG